MSGFVITVIIIIGLVVILYNRLVAARHRVLAA